MSRCKFSDMYLYKLTLSEGRAVVRASNFVETLHLCTILYKYMLCFFNMGTIICSVAL